METTVARPLKRNIVKEFGRHTIAISVAIAKAVVASAKTHPTVGPMSDAEIKRRMDYLTDMALELRASMHWGPERIADNLPAALSAFLDGREWEPPARSLWTPTDLVHG